MTSGRFGPAGEPLLPITVHASKDVTLEALVDTGFLGALTLPRRWRRVLARSRPVGEIEVEFADGTRAWEKVYEVAVTFDGERRTVTASLTRSDEALIGMELLGNRRLVIDAARGLLSVDVSRPHPRTEA